MDRYRIEIPVFKWQELSIVSLSVQGYNSRAQMNVLVEALTGMLRLEASSQLALQHGESVGITTAAMVVSLLRALYSHRPQS